MPKCLECGIELPRLQWTHFKYKCTGKFNNGTEYLQCYPNATLVDESVSKKTAITLENLVQKYGLVEGNIRWNSYREKQAYSNTYEYKRETHGWSIEQFNQFNKSRAVTLENLIKKHGVQEGTIIYEHYIEAQRKTTTPEYFINTYGEEAGMIKFHNFDRARFAAKNVRMISKREEELFQLLKCKVPNIIQQYRIDNRKPFDYAIPEIKKVIEFYGSYWHCDPRKYKSDYYHSQSKLYAYEIWDRDRNKRTEALEHGYDVYVAWEHDYTTNKQKTVDDIIGWIDGN